MSLRYIFTRRKSDTTANKWFQLILTEYLPQKIDHFHIKTCNIPELTISTNQRGYLSTILIKALIVSVLSDKPTPIT